jgi:hypothetical protein
MRFMLMHKMTDELEQGLPPDPEVMAGIDKLIAEGAESGVFLGGEGLKPTAQRKHIVYKNGKRTITDGPFTEAKELVAGFALMKVRSMDEALTWCDKFAAVNGDVRLFMGPVVEPWDLGFGEKPKDAPLRVLSLMQGDTKTEGNDEPPDPVHMAAMAKLIEEMTKAGVLEATGGLAGTKKGARVHFKGGKHTVTDGPFAESKELIAGYAILELPSKEAAVDWAVRFGKVVKVNEVEVRQFPEWS